MLFLLMKPIDRYTQDELEEMNCKSITCEIIIYTPK